jgi:hypothetical protein
VNVDQDVSVSEVNVLDQLPYLVHAHERTQLMYRHATHLLCIDAGRTRLRQPPETSASSGRRRTAREAA